MPGYEVSTWYGLWAVKGTPPQIVERMAAEVKKALADKDMQSRWHENGSEVPQMSQKEFATMLDKEIARWAEVVKTANVKLE